MDAADYNLKIGRYMEADPIGLEGGLNPYAYAGSNQVMNVDPSGLESLNLYWLTNNVTTIAERTLTRTAAGWGGALIEPSPFGEIAMTAVTIGVGAYEAYSYFSQSTTYVTPSGISLELDNQKTDRFIFRGGNGTNLTPRDVDINGMSYYLKPPIDEKYTFTTLSAVNSTGVLGALIDKPNHVSVFTTNPAMMQNWINTRPTANKNPHPYTLIMQEISIEMKKGELP